MLFHNFFCVKLSAWLRNWVARDLSVFKLGFEFSCDFGFSLHFNFRFKMRIPLSFWIQRYFFSVLLASNYNWSFEGSFLLFVIFFHLFYLF